MTSQPTRRTLTACLIVRDEEDRLPDALASVAFCDEIVVVDSGSRDGTVGAAEAAGARVIENAWPGFAAQRNVALDHARSDWVLEIDADERVTPALEEAIRTFLADPPAGVDLVAMPRRDIFLGRRLFRAATYPGYRFRLVRRGTYRHDESRTVHEGLLPRGRVWTLGGDLEHLLADSWREVLTDMVRYARLEARMLPRPVVARTAAAGMLARPAAKFLYRLAVGGGWRDGWRGAVWIARDCLSDALVWVFVLAHPDEGPRVPEHQRLRAHFGITKPTEGPTRLVALARRSLDAEQARGWLERAGAAGADCALITDAPVAQTDHLRILRIFRFTPLRLIEALEAEHQLGPIEALVPVGRRQRLLLRLLPAHLRGRRKPLSLAADPVRAATASSDR
jgi:glycosyltransferase involved in cell wall biosynthesis